MYNIGFLPNNIIGEIMIKDIMSKKIIFSSINSSIKDISKLMKENNVGFIPIKQNNKYIGVITDRDICLSLSIIKDLNDSIKSYITLNIVSIDINANINEALNLMSKYKVKRLLVKNKEDIIGVLSLSDILNYTNSDNIINTYKSIFYTHDNNTNISTQVDDFYL